MSRDLLFSVSRRDLDITWHCTPGPGGQKKNKTQNACRMLHRDSGATTQASERKERTANLKAAFRRLVEHPKFKAWWRRRAHEILSGETLDQMVERQMHPENLKVEVQCAEKWIPWEEARKSPIFCEHANEIPVLCACPGDCYCKGHTCQR